MSTRSRIAIEEPDGGILSIYCHSDGYLSWNGRLLLQHYSDPQRVGKLIELGNLSVLRETPESSRAYHRDVGEPKDDNEATRFSSLEEMKAASYFEEFFYLFRLDETWHWFEEDNIDELSPLANEERYLNSAKVVYN